MELYIIRHGQSANNVLNDEKLRTFDPTLTDLGKQQAERLAQYLANGNPREPEYTLPDGVSDQRNHGFTHLYCSAMHRALQTAAPLAQALGMTPEVWIDIHEQGGMYLDREGQMVGFPGKSRREILGEFPDYVLPETITDAGWYDITHGYEALHTGAGRAIKVALELRRRAAGEFKDARIGIITHGTFIDLLLKAFFGQLPTRQFYYSHYNTSITRLDFHEEYMLLRYTNRVDHLPPEMIS